MPLAGFLAFRHLIGFGRPRSSPPSPNRRVARRVRHRQLRRTSVRAPLGRYIGLNSRHLDRAERWFGRFGEVTVFFGRIIPAVRTFVSLPAGFARMSMGRFIVFSLLGSLIWNLGLLYGGDRTEQALAGPGRSRQAVHLRRRPDWSPRSSGSGCAAGRVRGGVSDGAHAGRERMPIVEHLLRQEQAVLAARHERADELGRLAHVLDAAAAVAKQDAVADHVVPRDLHDRSET